jgi:formylglycine-generating enzyme required for sulfatase activity
MKALSEAVGDRRSETNSLGMELVRIEGGAFEMGSSEGDRDERPVHLVRISRLFWMSATEVTNAQYEQFDPDHRKLRGKRGLSKGDDEAVVSVSWHDAVAFCRWLSEKEGQPYRLPTEAEWEYACRAGTTTAYHTGDELPPAYHRAQAFSWDPQPVDLTVGRTPPNPWGLHNVHGNVEEWCLDWYGPYPSTGPSTSSGRGSGQAPEEGQTDPVGPAEGTFKVTRGGSHNTDVAFLRCANRLGTLPEDRHWLIGFRVVQAETPGGAPLRERPVKRWQRDVRQAAFDWRKAGSGDTPCFLDPLPFVRPPAEGSGEPFYPHNHCPSIAWCDNGDLLACWFSTVSERGREMTILASRLRAGAEGWDPSSEFFKAPDRNMTGSSLFNDGQGTLYHWNGLEAGGGWANLALVLRTSRDSGATWSRPRLINAEHQRRNQVIDGASLMADGALIQPCDAVWRGNGGTAIHVSRDGGETWTDPGAGTPMPRFVDGGQGSTIAGIHAGVVELADGRLLAFGRGDSIRGQVGEGHNIGERMPMSLSADGGRTWTYCASPFPPIGGGQRLVLMRLREGPIFFASFTGAFTDHEGQAYRGYGLYASLSYDEGTSWPARRLLTPGKGEYGTAGHTRHFRADATHAEPRGYLAATQTPDGMIHLISSGLHYRFNLAWLEQDHRARLLQNPYTECAE